MTEAPQNVVLSFSRQREDRRSRFTAIRRLPNYGQDGAGLRDKGSDAYWSENPSHAVLRPGRQGAMDAREIIEEWKM